MNENQLSPELCQDYGEKFLALGWLEDALQFFQKGNAPAGLEKIKAICLDTGDAYLLGRLGRQETELWLRVANRALELEKIHFARRAFEQAGDQEKAREVLELLKGDNLEH